MTDRSVDAEIAANRKRAGDDVDDGTDGGDVPGGSIGVVAGSLLRPAGVDSADADDIEARREENDAEQRPE